jgi:hypothetical protein
LSGTPRCRRSARFNINARPQVAPLLLILLLHIGHCRISCFQSEIDHGVSLSASVDAAYKEAIVRRLGALEGIVSKRRDSTYLSGPCKDWREIKTTAWRQANKERWKLFGEERWGFSAFFPNDGNR